MLIRNKEKRNKKLNFVEKYALLRLDLTCQSLKLSFSFYSKCEVLHLIIAVHFGLVNI